jgi:purine-binding chemotaxis protein CheW
MSGNLPEELIDVEGEIFTEEDEDGEIGEPEPVETERVTVFRLGDQSYCAPVMEIRQIVESAELTRVPRTSEAVDGVMDLRGEIMAVINPWKHLNVEGDPNPWADQLVAVFTATPDEQPTGIRIDDIVGVEEFPVDDVHHDVERGDPGPNAGNAIVTGMVDRTDDGEVVERIPLLDSDALVAASGQHPHLTAATLE